MEHVKTFFKTLFWTLLIILVLGGGFWGYVRFFDHDLGAKVAKFFYKEIQVSECKSQIVQTGNLECTQGVDLLTKVYDLVEVNSQKIDGIEQKLDDLALKSSIVLQKTGDSKNLKEEEIKQIEEQIELLQKRLEELK